MFIFYIPQFLRTYESSFHNLSIESINKHVIAFIKLVQPLYVMRAVKRLANTIYNIFHIFVWGLKPFFVYKSCYQFF